VICPSCGAGLADASRFCPSCGSAVSEAETRLSDQPRTAATTTSGTAVWHGRFAPGTVLDNRYRIVSLLGRGGMGEVYRADDLRLEQPVALKFLPESLEMDPARLARFHGEVRTARQVSHPNVCRVYDIGSTDGRHFLSMEYVDGEDLASLLRRIGRLPADKGVEVARQLCAGLAAAHDRGVLHRDLKPANIMIDGSGRARLTDFGIAGAASTGEDVRAGTPAYMAPEQLSGREVTVKSDLFALGLVLYEVFTGRRAFDAPTIADLVKQHERGAPTSPSTTVSDLNPAIERTIMRCLETDPALRPASALAVAAGLPGASPLEAALAAGETPSPEMVAAAGTTGSLTQRQALSLAIGCGACLLLLAAMADRSTVLSRMPPFKNPAVLVDRAEQIVSRLGYPRAVDSLVSFELDNDYIRHIAETDPSKDRWQRVSAGRPPAITFWYRASPRELISWQVANEPLFHDPPGIYSGMVRLRLDADGRLVYFDAVPQQSPGAPGEPSGDGSAATGDPWRPLFQEAGLDRTAFTPTGEGWTPPYYADARAAWNGTLGPHAEKVRVEAAAHQGRPVYFALIGPWSRPAMQQRPPGSDSWRDYISLVLLSGSLVAAAVMARRNVRAGRGDRDGALRLAAFVFTVQTIEFVLGAHHAPDLGVEWTQIFRGASVSLFTAGSIWLLYLALEPAARRFWPNLLIAWSRMLTGRVSDPMIGRDILIGLLAGLISSALIRLQYFLPSLMGRPSSDLGNVRLEPLLGIRHALSAFLTQPDDVVLTALVMLMLLVGARLVLRRLSLAALAATTVITLLFLRGYESADVFTIAASITGACLVMFVFLRFGLLAGAALIFALNMSFTFPFTANTRAWYLGTALIGFALFAALVVWAFRVSRGAGRAAVHVV
jgi:Protein kinase domain/zinc-ribbon domain